MLFLHTKFNHIPADVRVQWLEGDAQRQDAGHSWTAFSNVGEKHLSCLDDDGDAASHATLLGSCPVRSV